MGLRRRLEGVVQCSVRMLHLHMAPGTRAIRLLLAACTMACSWATAAARAVWQLKAPPVLLSPAFLSLRWSLVLGTLRLAHY